ncbi:MAG: DUF1285 domain-containing protein [Pseudomonadota bacterium]
MGPPPVHLWNPPYCGDLDIRIGRDGQWWYLGTPIGREPLVKLFASVLKLEDGRYFLVTPVEKIGITVDDAPFVAVDFRVEADASGADGSLDGQHGGRADAAHSGAHGWARTGAHGGLHSGAHIVFTTNVGDETVAGPDNPIRVVRDPTTGEPAPYVHVRRGLEALIDRKSFYRLVDIGEVRPHGGEDWFGLASGGVFFPIIPAAELEL